MPHSCVHVPLKQSLLPPAGPPVSRCRRPYLSLPPRLPLPRPVETRPRQLHRPEAVRPLLAPPRFVPTVDQLHHSLSATAPPPFPAPLPGLVRALAPRLQSARQCPSHQLCDDVHPGVDSIYPPRRRPPLQSPAPHPRQHVHPAVPRFALVRSRPPLDLPSCLLQSQPVAQHRRHVSQLRAGLVRAMADPATKAVVVDHLSVCQPQGPVGPVSRRVPRHQHHLPISCPLSHSHQPVPVPAPPQI